MADTSVSTAIVTPDRGIVTWDAEGTEGGKFHSRTLHVPSDKSGLTIGRGYDMKERNAAGIVGDLTAAGLTLENATILSRAAGLSGDNAKQFIIDNNLKDMEISHACQKALFDRTYANVAADVLRLSKKVDVTEKYGQLDLKKLHPAIADTLVDLHFRGDYTGTARAKIQKLAVDNDLEGFAKAMSDKANWNNVPKDRFDRRVELLEQAVADKQKTDKLKKLAQPALK